MRVLFGLVAIVSLIGCASKETSAEAQARIEKKYEERVGTARKAELIEDFGTPEWCRANDSGVETCRFFKKKGTKWMGEKRDRTHYTTYDEIVAEFDEKNVLRAFKASAQRE